MKTFKNILKANVAALQLIEEVVHNVVMISEDGRSELSLHASEETHCIESIQSKYIRIGRQSSIR